MFYPYSDRPVGKTGQIRPPPSPPQHTNLPNLAISIVGILMASIFLLSSFVFIIKCCHNWHRPDVIRQLSRYQRRRRNTSDRTLTSLYLSSVATRGLDQSTKQAIPTIKFRREEQRDLLCECAVCLNEFQDEESVRMLPNCFHVFHIDCIDTWLQTHANCPLCRAEITSASAMPLTEHHVVIDVTGEENNLTPRSDEGSRNTNADPTATSTTDSCAGKLLHKHLSFGDLRGKDEDFIVQPIRRSFSMGSSSERRLYMAVQVILRQNPHFWEVSSGEGTSVTSNSWRIPRSFLSLNGHCRNSRNYVLPIENEQ